MTHRICAHPGALCTATSYYSNRQSTAKNPHGPRTGSPPAATQHKHRYKRETLTHKAEAVTAGRTKHRYNMPTFTPVPVINEATPGLIAPSCSQQHQFQQYCLSEEHKSLTNSHAPPKAPLLENNPASVPAPVQSTGNAQPLSLHQAHPMGLHNCALLRSSLNPVHPQLLPSVRFSPNNK